MDELALYEEIVRLTKARRPAVLATVIDTNGSSPRKAGAKMLVYHDGATAGTVGGGKIEADTIAAACGVLKSGKPRTLAFNLTEAHGGVCGGEVLVYLEPLIAAPRCVIIGDGHVGQAVNRAANHAGFLVNMVDESDNLTPLLDGADCHTYIFIATSDHQEDFIAAAKALATEARYVAVLGSIKKRKAMEEFLRQTGRTPQDIARLVSPAGLDIGAETPEEIAISVVAQMIQVRRVDANENRRPAARCRPVAPHGRLQAAAAAGK